jgi:ABC-2 type transport system permease protein
MSPVGTLWQVALREISQRGRSKAFIVTNVVIAILVAAMIVIPSLFAGGTSESSVGSVGDGNQVIVDTAVLLGNANDEPNEEPSVAIEVVEYETRDTAEEALLDGDVDVVLVNGEELVIENAGGFLGDASISGLLQQAAATVQLEAAVSEGGQAAADVVEIMTSDPLETSAVTGEGDEEANEARGLIAYVGLMFLYIAVLLYGTWILTGVTEEKSNRVVEVLVSAIRPWQLLGGKILGIGTLGILQFAGTITIAVVVLRATGAFDLPPVELFSIVNLVIWFVLGFLMFAVLFGAAGSLVSRAEDAQSVALPLSLTAVAGFFVSIVSLSNPTGPVAVIGTLVPLTAPFVVPVRTALQAIPVWQYLLSVVLTSATIVALVFAAGRIYTGALLRFGGRTKVREAWRSTSE